MGPALRLRPNGAHPDQLQVHGRHDIGFKVFADRNDRHFAFGHSGFTQRVIIACVSHNRVAILSARGVT